MIGFDIGGTKCAVCIGKEVDIDDVYFNVRINVK